MGIVDLFNLKDNVAIVTGASSGLGVAFALAMAEAGADVVCADKEENGLIETVNKIKKIDRKSIGIVTDVSKEKDVKNMVKQSLKEFGRIDILFNNAGIVETPVPAHELSLEEWDKVIAVDLTGVFLCAKEVLKVMIEQKSGKLINISSIWGQVGSSVFPVPAYAAAKGGVINFTRELAIEYAEYGINVNCIAPGSFKTEIGGGDYNDPQFLDTILNLIPIKKVGVPNDLKGVAIFLASKASNFITGHILTIDGGWLAR